MEITKERIMILCTMAREGARDDAGRQFAVGMLEEFQQAWMKAERDQEYQAQAGLDAEIASKVKDAEDKLREELTANKRDLDKSTPIPAPVLSHPNGKDRNPHAP